MKKSDKKIISINLENVRISPHHLNLLLAGIVGAAFALGFVVIHGMLTTNWSL